MATFNKKAVSKVSFSSVQAEGVSEDKKAVAVLFEDGTQMVINGGLASVKQMAAQSNSQITELQGRLAELNEMEAAIAAIPA
jgi:hypothetical protein